MPRLAIIALFCAVAAAQSSDPISVALVLDTSGSIGAKIPQSRAVFDEFLKTASPRDEFVLIRSADHPTVETGFIADAAQLKTRVASMQAAGRSALLDAIQIAVAELKQANNTHRIVLVISDGADNASANAKADIEELARKSDVRIFAVGIHELPTARSRTPEESAGPELLAGLAEHTGGKYSAPAPGKLADAAAALAAEMRK